MAVNLSRKGDTWYRVEDYSADYVVLRKFQVLRSTPQGVWLDLYPYPNKFCLIGVGKRYAHATVEQALNSFMARKKRQILILTNQLRRAESALELTQRSLKDGSTLPFRTPAFCHFFEDN